MAPSSSAPAAAPDKVKEFFTRVIHDLDSFNGHAVEYARDALKFADDALPYIDRAAKVGGAIAMAVGGVGVPIGLFMMNADRFIGGAETLVKTVDGIFLPANRANELGAAAVRDATPAEKADYVGDNLQAAHPEVPRNIINAHVAAAVAEKHLTLPEPPVPETASA